MPQDNFGKEIKEGSTLSLIVGIPGREVIAKVITKRGRLYVHNDNEGSITVAQALKYYPVEVIA